MIDNTALVSRLQPILSALEQDMLSRLETTPELDEHSRAEHARASTAGRTATAYEDWRRGEVTQAAVAWILGCVFVRFIEDNGLIDSPLISGPRGRLEAALGRREEYFRKVPNHTDREYLESCFAEVSKFPAVEALYHSRLNPLWTLKPSADGARLLREAFTEIDPATGELVFDFGAADLDTRFLGDLYQDLSEDAKARFALLQTPDFVEAFILDETLDPAVEEFGLADTRLIDPTCGSGHFLIGAFQRLFRAWADREPGTSRVVLAQRALDAVHGVDLNPFATAIARFRLVVAALQACGIRRLAEAPAFRVHLATGDSLLHGPEAGQFAGFGSYRESIRHVFETEDAPELQRLLGQGYHVVVGNPPYITVKDKAVKAAIKSRYPSCSGLWVMTVPFMERFVQLAGADGAAGFIGKITSSTFAKREFGTKLVRDFLPKSDLQAVMDVSGVHLPGHGTDVVLMFGRARAPKTQTVRFVQKERGDEADPDAAGGAWIELIGHHREVGFVGHYFRVAEVPRSRLAKHPWSFGGGGAQEVKEQLEAKSTGPLSNRLDAIGFGAISGLDPALLLGPPGEARPAAGDAVVPALTGDSVREWTIDTISGIRSFSTDPVEPIWPEHPAARRTLWRTRPLLARRLKFGESILKKGMAWYDWREIYPLKLNARNAIVFGEIATRNQFAIRPEGVVTTQTSPVMTFPASTGTDAIYAVLEYLNSSSACFWLMQVCATKGAHASKKRTRDERFVFNARNVERLPLPPVIYGVYARRLHALVGDRERRLAKLFEPAGTGSSLRSRIDAAIAADARDLAQMRALQEEIDWATYRAFGFTDLDVVESPEDVPDVAPGERAFEIAIARGAGNESHAWFERDGIESCTELPDHWPAAYRELVAHRVEAISNADAIKVIEQPKHKRRWVGRSGQERVQLRAHEFAVSQVEQLDLWRDARMHGASELADSLRGIPLAEDAARVARDDEDSDLGKVVNDLLLSAAVPIPSTTCYTASGLDKLSLWRRAWGEQRDAERGLGLTSDDPGTGFSGDRLLKAGYFASFAPQEFGAADYQDDTYWQVRGKLDVPRERFFASFAAPGAADSTASFGLASWSPLERARAIATRVMEMRETGEFETEDLYPLLLAVLEEIPWIHQWHAGTVPLYGGPPGRYFQDWLDGQLAELSVTEDALLEWRPPAPVRTRSRQAVTR